MDAKVSVSLARLVEAAMAGNTESVTAYASQLKSRLAELGDTEASERIEECIRGGRTTKKAGVTRMGTPKPIIPVDSESCLPIADELLASETVQVFLPEQAESSVNSFLECIRNSEKLASRGVHAPASLLMHGPPGCGKTLVARHIAASLGLPLLTARTDSLISSYLGSTSKNLRMLFEHAAARKCVLFLDEFDAIAKMRDDQHELGELKRVVISLLQNIDANGTQYILLAATNHPHLLDAAVWRRFAYTVAIGLPDDAARLRMLRSFLGHSVDDDVLLMVSQLSDGLSGAELRSIADDAVRETVLNDHSKLEASTLGRCVAGKLADRRGLSAEEAIITLRIKFGKKANQTMLARMSGLSQSTVHRILREAKLNGRLRTADD